MGLILAYEVRLRLCGLMTLCFASLSGDEERAENKYYRAEIHSKKVSEL